MLFVVEKPLCNFGGIIRIMCPSSTFALCRAGSIEYQEEQVEGPQASVSSYRCGNRECQAEAPEEIDVCEQCLMKQKYIWHIDVDEII